jgi:hypothetical protein
VFESPAAGADVLLAAVRGLGEVVRLDTSTNPDTQTVTSAKRGFSVTIQSLATVPARENNNLRVASRSVADAFNKLRETVRSAGGRIVTNQLSEQDKNNVTAQLDFEVKREKFAAIEAAVGEAGVVLSRNVVRSADAQNSIDSKVMVQVGFVDERTVPPREAISLQVAADDVAARYEKLLGALREAGARVLDSQIDQQDPSRATANVQFDVRRENRAAAEKALAEAGGVFGRSVARPSEGQAAIEDKVRFNVSLSDVDTLAPRETTKMAVEANEVTGAAHDVETTAIALGGRKVDSDWAQQPGGQTVARVVVDVPLARAEELLTKARDDRRVLSVQKDRTAGAPEGVLGRARLQITISTPDQIVQNDQSLGNSIRSGLATSVYWLLKSLTWIIVGVCLVAPWLVLLWVARKLFRRRRSTTATTTPPAAAPAV